MDQSIPEVQRINFLDIPLDSVPPEKMGEVVLSLLKNGKSNQIVLLTFRGLLRAKINAEFRDCLRNAALVIPVSKRITKGAHFLKTAPLYLYRPFPFLIKILGILENQQKTVYLLGGNKNMVETAEGTLRASFPRLRFVGRFSAAYSSDMEKNILLAIKKASPSLLLTGRGIKGKDLWLYRHRRALNPGITVWNKISYDVFSGRKRKPPEKPGARFIKEFFRTLFRPWRLFYIFLYFWYIALLIFYRIKLKPGKN